jgi:hypothetical protein
MPKASLFVLISLISDNYKGDPFAKSITYHHHSKTTCFGVINLPLTIKKDAFYDIKTTCFALRSTFAFTSSPSYRGKAPEGTGIKTACCREREAG